MTNLKGKKFDDFEGKPTVDISLRRLPGLWIIWKKRRTKLQNDIYKKLNFFWLVTLIIILRISNLNWSISMPEFQLVYFI